ncbi:MAG: hypothetical protein ACYC3I_17915 [Gemmataceae bacterium]
MGTLKIDGGCTPVNKTKPIASTPNVERTARFGFRQVTDVLRNLRHLPIHFRPLFGIEQVITVTKLPVGDSDLDIHFWTGFGWLIEDGFNNPTTPEMFGVLSAVVESVGIRASTLFQSIGKDGQILESPVGRDAFPPF